MKKCMLLWATPKPDTQPTPSTLKRTFLQRERHVMVGRRHVVEKMRNSFHCYSFLDCLASPPVK